MRSSGDIGIQTGANLALQFVPLIRKIANFTFLSVLILFGAFQLSGLYGSVPILLMGLGICIPLHAWIRCKGRGIPVLLIMAFQALVIYTTPLIVQNEDLRTQYSDQDFLWSGIEVFSFFFFLTLGWRFFLYRVKPNAIHYHGFSFLEGFSLGRLATTSTMLLLGSLVYRISINEGWIGFVFQILPGTFYSIFQTFADSASMIGGLLGGVLIGQGLMKSSNKLLFWFLFWCIFLVTVSGFLLSSVTGFIVSTLFGLFVGRGRFPLRVFLGIATVFAFLNVSKFEMRQKYWEDDRSNVSFPLASLPDIFAEWTDASLDVIFGEAGSSGYVSNASDSDQGLLERINGLQNLLFVQKEVNEHSRSVLYGETYTLIPKLLIPRVFWPSKPRAHEGQVLLNVHFDRQTEEATFQTYVAWGLLPEAYGNFGRIWGSVFIGLMLGTLAGLLEGWSRRYPLFSFQMLLILSVIIKLGISFEMVASVFITSTFQMLVAITLGLFFFLRRKRLEAVVA